MARYGRNCKGLNALIDKIRMTPLNVPILVLQSFLYILLRVAIILYTNTDILAASILNPYKLSVFVYFALTQTAMHHAVVLIDCCLFLQFLKILLIF